MEQDREQPVEDKYRENIEPPKRPAPSAKTAAERWGIPLQDIPDVALRGSTTREEAPAPEAPVRKVIDIPELPKAEEGLRQLRTYRSDAEDAVKKQNASVVKIALAEQERKADIEQVVAAETPSGDMAKKILVGFLSLILVAAGAGALYFLYGYVKGSEPAPVTETETPGPIIPDTERVIDATGKSPELLSLAVRGTLAGSATTGITEYAVTEKRAEGAYELPAAEFLERAGVAIPSAFSRALTPEFTLGTRIADSGTEPFLILKNDFYEASFSGMLAWEKTMKEELAKIFGPLEAATGTPLTTSDILDPERPFEDGIVKNRDVRILRGDSGDIILLYAFNDKNTIVITTRTEGLKDLLDRIEKRQFVR